MVIGPAVTGTLQIQGTGGHPNSGPRARGVRVTTGPGDGWSICTGAPCFFFQTSWGSMIQSDAHEPPTDKPQEQMIPQQADVLMVCSSEHGKELPNSTRIYI